MLNKTRSTIAVLMVISLAALSACEPSAGLSLAAGPISQEISESKFCKRFISRKYFDTRANKRNLSIPNSRNVWAELDRRSGSRSNQSDYRKWWACKYVLKGKISNLSDNPYNDQRPSTSITKDSQRNATHQPVQSPSAYQAGLSAIISNPQTPANQALAICRPQANTAKSQASNQSKQALRPTPYKSTCRRNFSGSYDCSSQRISGGFWGGVADGVASSSAGRNAYNAVLSSCLAQYGWRQ